MSQFTSIYSGSFVSNGSALTLSLPAGYTEIELTNISDLGSTGAETPVMKAYGSSLMPAGAAIYALKTSSAATLALSVTTASNGFTFLADSAAIAPSAPLNITSISQAAPAVVALSSTAGLVEGGTISLYNPTGMLQIGGWNFTIASVIANTSVTLAYLDSSAFAAAASGGSLSAIQSQGRFIPRVQQITKITKASSAVITLSVTHGYVAGEVVTIYCPSAFGMTQINGLQATITAVDLTNNTITVNIDSTSFSSFAFPTSAVAAAGVNFPLVVPVGESVSSAYQNLVSDATYNSAVTGLVIGTSVQSSGQTYQFVARKGLSQ